MLFCLDCCYSDQGSGGKVALSRMLLNDVRFFVVNCQREYSDAQKSSRLFLDMQAHQAYGRSGVSEACPKQLSQAETCPMLLDRVVSGECRGDGRRDGPHHRVLMESAHLFRSGRL